MRSRAKQGCLSDFVLRANLFCCYPHPPLASGPRLLASQCGLLGQPASLPKDPPGLQSQAGTAEASGLVGCAVPPLCLSSVQTAVTELSRSNKSPSAKHVLLFVLLLWRTELMQKHSRWVSFQKYEESPKQNWMMSHVS